MSDVKQIIVMRTDLNMRKGKMIAQGAHSSIAFLTNWMSRNGHTELTDDTPPRHQYNFILPEVWSEWIQGRFTKICVRVNSEEELLDIHARATEAGLVCHLIRDAGLTEFGGVATNTCLAIGPDYAERIDPITGHLTLL